MTLSADEEACLSEAELELLRFHELETARIQVAACERRRQQAVARFKAAKKAVREHHHRHR